jgi:hypothetical protein
MDAKIATIISNEVTLTKGGNFDEKNERRLATGEVIEYFGSL